MKMSDYAKDNALVSIAAVSFVAGYFEGLQTGIIFFVICAGGHLFFDCFCDRHFPNQQIRKD